MKKFQNMRANLEEPSIHQNIFVVFDIQLLGKQIWKHQLTNFVRIGKY